MHELITKPVYICLHCKEPTYDTGNCDNCGKELWPAKDVITKLQPKCTCGTTLLEYNNPDDPMIAAECPNCGAQYTV